MMQDLRYGVRILLKSPSFTAITVLILSLGISSNTTIFSIVNAVLLRPYPYVDTDRWVYLYEKPSAEGLDQVAVSDPNYRDWRAQSKSFADMALWTPVTLGLSGSGEPERVQTVVITAGIFPALGGAPALGRFYTGSDDPQSGSRVAVISYGLWQRRFGGDPNVL